ncbi:hypothetical protein QF038_003674 [Pseudarthrobacter sp. W1I19]|uniref:hypothetical protein n=1 Tax=Pseudarthrobacter sp. W1I19 TaxID=3042288 RepID=UPI00278328FF|nr:hypothetical protein [Pseudarthrobacter sp. W1I19]MDQ0925166.1 hypothetical protein [Pseudarthrobacter sp. W1I19]
MENQLHATGDKSGRSHFHKNSRRRAGLPAKRFFRRFSGLSDVPAEDLEALSESLKGGMDCHPASQVMALQAMVGEELRARAAANGG